MDILVTVGVILLLIALAAGMIHLVNERHEQSIATHHYESFHAGDPPGGGKAGTEPDEGDQRRDG